ncbi:hypothetical protein IAS59_001853 [Cryptococcus gattii]
MCLAPLYSSLNRRAAPRSSLGSLLVRDGRHIVSEGSIRRRTAVCPTILSLSSSRPKGRSKLNYICHSGSAAIDPHTVLACLTHILPLLLYQLTNVIT